MSMFRKLTTLFTATAQQPLHQLIDRNTIEIFEQEIRQAENALPTAKFHLASVMAERRKLEREIETLSDRLQTRITQCQAALDQQDESLARELAALIADDENLHSSLQKQADHLQVQETQLTQQMRKAVHSLQHYQRELALAKAHRHAHNALGALGSCSSELTTRLGDMELSVQTLRQQHLHQLEMSNAMARIDCDLNGENLDQRLERAGITTGKHNGDAVLQRLRASAQQRSSQ